MVISERGRRGERSLELGVLMLKGETWGVGGQKTAILRAEGNWVVHWWESFRGGAGGIRKMRGKASQYRGYGKGSRLAYSLSKKEGGQRQKFHVEPIDIQHKEGGKPREGRMQGLGHGNVEKERKEMPETSPLRGRE